MTITPAVLSQSRTIPVMMPSFTPRVHGRLEGEKTLCEAKKTNQIGLKTIVSLGLALILGATWSIPGAIVVGLSSYFLLRILEVITDCSDSFSPSFSWSSVARSFERFAASAAPTFTPRTYSYDAQYNPASSHATFGSRTFGSQPSTWPSSFSHTPHYQTSTSDIPDVTFSQPQYPNPSHGTFGSRLFGDSDLPLPHYGTSTTPHATFGSRTV